MLNVARNQCSTAGSLSLKIESCTLSIVCWLACAVAVDVRMMQVVNDLWQDQKTPSCIITVN